MPGELFEYAILRAVPRVERGECLNVGVVLFCKALRFLDARVEVDARRLLALDPDADLAEIRAHLATFPAICAGGPGAGALAGMDQQERFRWLTAPRSTVIQASPVHSGRTADPRAELDHLTETMVLTRGRAG